MEQFPSQAGLSETPKLAFLVGKVSSGGCRRARDGGLASRNGRPGALPFAHGGPFFKHEWMGSGSFDVPGRSRGPPWVSAFQKDRARAVSTGEFEWSR